jgi:hypothetical protein
MTNETFGMTFQYAVCQHFDLANSISMKRIDKKLLNRFINSKIIPKIFKTFEPVEYLTDSKEFTSHCRLPQISAI